MLLHVKVSPNAKVTEVLGFENDQLKIRLHATPEKGKANQELIDYLAEALKLPKQEVKLVKGQTSRLKTLHLPDSTSLPW